MRTPAGETFERIDLRPTGSTTSYNGRRYDKAPDQTTSTCLHRVSPGELGGPVPTQEMPFMHMTHERAPMPKKGFTHVHHFWADRALHALAWLWKACSRRGRSSDALRADVLGGAGDVGPVVAEPLQSIQFGKVGGSLVNQYMTGVYYVSSLIAECSVRYNLEGSQPSRGKRQSLVKTWRTSPRSAS